MKLDRDRGGEVFERMVKNCTDSDAFDRALGVRSRYNHFNSDHRDGIMIQKFEKEFVDDYRTRKTHPDYLPVAITVFEDASDIEKMSWKSVTLDVEDLKKFVNQVQVIIADVEYEAGRIVTYAWEEESEAQAGAAQDRDLAGVPEARRPGVDARASGDV